MRKGDGVEAADGEIIPVANKKGEKPPPSRRALPRLDVKLGIGASGAI